jgi:hypothetical protein
LSENFYSIEFLRQFGIIEKGTYIGWKDESWEYKKSFYGQYGIQTEYGVSIHRALEIWKMGGVIEIIVGGPLVPDPDSPGDTIEAWGHAAGVSDVWEVGDFVYFWVFSDEDQGNDGGIVELPFIVNSKTSQWWGPAWMTGASGFDLVGEYYVPEPGTWVMMIAGFGLVGAGLRARRRREAAAA